MALFPLSGCLNIRPQLIYRAVLFAYKAWVLFFCVYVWHLLNLPNFKYLTPWWFILRDTQFYFVSPFEADLDTSQLRLNLLIC